MHSIPEGTEEKDKDPTQSQKHSQVLSQAVPRESSILRYASLSVYVWASAVVIVVDRGT